MSLWRLTRDEMAGAWRSLRYDLARRASERGWHIGPAIPPEGPPATAGDPMGTGRSPRLVAAAALAILAVGGSAGSYLAVVSGVGSLMDEPTGPEPYPLAAEAAPQAVMATPTTVVTRSGERSAVAPGRVTVVTVTVSPPATTAPVAGAPRQPARGATTPPVRLPGTPTRPGAPARTATPEPPCDCSNPPVPTPTSPPSPSPSVSPSGDPSPTAEPSDPTATPSDDPSTPTDSDDDPSGEPDDDRNDDRNVRRGIG